MYIKMCVKICTRESLIKKGLGDSSIIDKAEKIVPIFGSDTSSYTYIELENKVFGLFFDYYMEESYDIEYCKEKFPHLFI